MTLGPHSCRATAEGAKQQLPLLVGRDIYFIHPCSTLPFSSPWSVSFICYSCALEGIWVFFCLKTILTQHFRAKAVLLVGGNKG